jgi:hypothetical protein
MSPSKLDFNVRKFCNLKLENFYKISLKPRVDNKNNARDPTRFHFSLRLSYNPPPKKKIKVKKKFFLTTHQYLPAKKSDRSKKIFNRIIN